MQRYDCKLLMQVRFMGHILWCNIYKIDIQALIEKLNATKKL